MKARLGGIHVAEGLLAIGALVTEWQERLSLRDWRISVEPVDVWEMGKKSRSSDVHYELCEKSATVRFMPEGNPSLSTAPFAYDLEAAVVHELLHLVLADQPEPENDTQNTLLEQGINAVARVLVELKRAAEPTPPTGEPCDCCGRPMVDGIHTRVTDTNRYARLCDPCSTVLPVPVSEQDLIRGAVRSSSKLEDCHESANP